MTDIQPMNGQLTVRDTTVAGLIAHLTGLVEMDPRIGSYYVVMDHPEGPDDSLWNGKTCRFADSDTLELECNG